VLGLGRMHQSNFKQQDVMIRAYAQSVLPQHGIKLILIGDGTKLNDFKELAKELGLTDKVLFLGFKENPYPYISKAEFMLLTSKRSEEHTSELQSRENLVCRLLLEKKKNNRE